MTEQEAQYTDQSDLLATGEEYSLDDAEIPKGTFTPTLPGVYISNTRTLKPANGQPGFVKRQTDGQFGINLVLSGGLVAPGARGASDTRFPFSKYINTSLRVVLDFSKRPPEPFLTNEIDPATGKFKPLRASELSRYVRLAGLEPKGLKFTPNGDGSFGGTLLEAIQSTLQTPVGVRIDWEDQTSKDEDTGKYPDPVLNTYDFRKRDENGNIVNAANGAPIYVTEVVGVIEERVSQAGNAYKAFKADPTGRTFKARAVVSYFTKVPSSK